MGGSAGSKASLTKTKGNYFAKLRTGWRKPKGIDNRARQKFRGTTIMPKIGYGSAKKTRHMLPNGFYKFKVQQISDLEMLLMHNGKFCVELAHNLSSRSRREIVARAEQLGLFVTNKFSRVASTEAE